MRGGKKVVTETVNNMPKPISPAMGPHAPHAVTKMNLATSIQNSPAVDHSTTTPSTPSQYPELIPTSVSDSSYDTSILQKHKNAIANVGVKQKGDTAETPLNEPLQHDPNTFDRIKQRAMSSDSSNPPEVQQNWSSNFQTSHSTPSSPLVGSGSPSISTSVSSPTSINEVPKRGYATRTVNRQDKKSPDPQAQYNNPPTPHPEIHRQRCDQPGCDGMHCLLLCGNFKDRKAVGHTTHGHPPKEPGKTEVTISQNDLNGNPGPQQIIFYDDAHEVNPTPQHVNGTQKINNDPNIQQTIITYEDKK